MFFNRLVHQRLRERGLVDLIVSVLAVPNQIHDHVVRILLTVSRCKSKNTNNCFGVIGVNVKDGCIKRFAKIRGVDGRATLPRICCETNLVVSDNVNCPTGAVPLETCHLHGFVHNTLPSKGSVAVKKNGNNRFSSLITLVMHFSTTLAHDKRINSLKM